MLRIVAGNPHPDRRQTGPTTGPGPGIRPVLLPATARADVVTTWVAVAEFVAPRYGGPQQQTRAFAMIQPSVHDALNTIASRYQRRRPVRSPPRVARCGVAAASRHVMLELLAPIPDSPEKDAALAAIQTAFDATVGPGPYDAPTTAGLVVGEAAADAILALRAGDGSDNPHLPYDEPVAPGVHQPTPNPEFPAVTTPLFRTGPTLRRSRSTTARSSRSSPVRFSISWVTRIRPSTTR